MGRERYPHPRGLLITADGGGSNGSRVRLWKLELQTLADEIGIPITVCHLPPGKSKWNKIEAPPFLVHHRQLARQAARQPSGMAAKAAVSWSMPPLTQPALPAMSLGSGLRPAQGQAATP